MPSGNISTTSILNPISEASICQGTMLLWCSRRVTKTVEDDVRLALPQVPATRLIPSVAPAVKIISAFCIALCNAVVKIGSDNIHFLKPRYLKKYEKLE